jgi:diguanylate cyclase (GGDEF)-like protein/PAS domain S-box-containing protein
MTMKKKVEKAGAELGLYRKIVENMAEGVFLVRARDNIIVYANPPIEQILGYASGELDGKHIRTLNAPTDKNPAAVAEEIVQSLKASGVWRGEVQNIKKDGTVFWCQVNVSTFEHPQHGTVWVSINQDITERKRAEVALQESELKYRSLIECSSDAIFCADENGQYKFTNRVFASNFEKDPEYFVGKTFWDIYPKEAADFRLEITKRVFQTGESESLEGKVALPGKTSDFHITVNPIKDETGKVVLTLTQATDITERKRAEDALQQSETRYRKLFENMQEGFMVQDIVEDEAGKPVDVRYLEINPAIERFLGKPRAEIVGRTRNEVLGMPDPEVVDANFRVASTGQPFHMVRYSHGAKRWVESFSYSFSPGQVATLVLDITERKQAEEALRESEQSFRTSFSNAPIGMALVDIHERFLQVNQALCNILGYTEEQLLETSVPAITHPDDIQVEAKYKTQTEAGEIQSFQFEKRYLHADGHMVWGILSVSGVSDEAGSLLYYIGQLEDITERKQMEQELQAERDFATQIINTMGQGLTVTNADGQFEFVNKAYARLFGYETGDLIGKSPNDMTLPEDQVVLDEQRKERQSGKTSTYESRLRRPDGSIAHVLITGVPRLRAGQYAGAIAVITDLTERKHAEDALRASNAKLETLVRVSPLAITLLDINGNVQLWNTAAEQIFGWASQEVVGHPNPIVPANKQNEYAAWSSQILHGKPISNQEAVRQRKDGSFVEVSISSAPVYDATGIVAGRMAIVADITERKRVENRLREAEAKYRDIFENAIDGIFQSTPQGRFLRVNAAMAHIFGYETPGKMILSIGNKIATQIYARPSQHVEFTRLLEQTGVAKDFEAENYRKDGSIIWTRASARTIRDSNGAILYYEGFVEDVTERKRAEAELKNANKTLQSRFDEIQSLQETLRDQATRDSLTGLYNRRYLFETMERELARAKRDTYPISVLMIDIDHFKDFNDTYGHQAGDEVLIALGGLLRHNVRQSDIACRYGGEEFIVIMPEANKTDVAQRADAIRNNFNNLHINYDGVDLFSTISMGVAFYPQHGNDMNKIIKAADAALYEAKQTGRNCVHIWKNA